MEKFKIKDLVKKAWAEVINFITPGRICFLSSFIFVYVFFLMVKYNHKLMDEAYVNGVEVTLIDKRYHERGSQYFFIYETNDGHILKNRVGVKQYTSKNIGDKTKLNNVYKGEIGIENDAALASLCAFVGIFSIMIAIVLFMGNCGEWILWIVTGTIWFIESIVDLIKLSKKIYKKFRKKNDKGK